MGLATLTCHIFTTTKIYITEQGNLKSQEVYSHSPPEISVTEKPWNYDLAKRGTKEDYRKEKNCLCVRDRIGYPAGLWTSEVNDSLL